MRCDSYYYKLWHLHLENGSCVVLFVETIHQLGSTVHWQIRVKTLIVLQFNTFAVHIIYLSYWWASGWQYWREPKNCWIADVWVKCPLRKGEGTTPYNGLYRRLLPIIVGRGDWLGNPANIKVENNSAVGCVGSFLTVHNPLFFVPKLWLNKLMQSFCWSIAMLLNVVYESFMRVT